VIDKYGDDAEQALGFATHAPIGAGGCEDHCLGFANAEENLLAREICTLL